MVGSAPAPAGSVGTGRATFTSRAVILAVVVLALALALAYPLRQYLGQRGEIRALEERTAVQQRRVGELEAAYRRWQDPEYVKTQARERLAYVLPGEVAYVVIGPDEDLRRAPLGSITGPRAPWYESLLGSLGEAARPTPAGER